MRTTLPEVPPAATEPAMVRRLVCVKLSPERVKVPVPPPRR